MFDTLIKALRTPIAKFVERAVGYGLTVMYAKAGIDASEVQDDTAAITSAVMALVIAGATMLVDFLHHKADKAEQPKTTN